ncbi:MAG: flgF [Verrucomicrobiaceae bacterium]|nr:flgF [Verrucomicrobiaceae bacterium]
MDKALYLAMTGAKHIERAQAVHANNMANATTTGFRADFEQARAMSVYYGDGLPSRTYSLAENPGTDFTMGSLAETGRELDVAIDGPGWIAVQGANGKEAYTRAGALQTNALGQLQTADGRAVLGESGPLTIPPNEKVQIAQDGTLSVRELGQAPNALGQLGRIKLVNPKDSQLQKGEDGAMYLRAGQPALKIDDTVRVKSGFIENSNVNIVDEFTNVIALARQFDMHLKLMRTTEENNSSATKLLQVS